MGLLVVTIWAAGVLIALPQLLHWSSMGIVDPDIPDGKLLLYSLLSWFIYPIYLIVVLLNRKFKK